MESKAAVPLYKKPKRQEQEGAKHYKAAVEGAKERHEQVGDNYYKDAVKGTKKDTTRSEPTGSLLFVSFFAPSIYSSFVSL